jgi:hypothetical protein
MVIKFGKPISLKPYYEKYQASQRETMMEINKVVREEIKDMMLHIEDIENYDAIDFLRENGYGKKYAKTHGYKVNYLPSRLLSDQSLVNDLQKASEKYPDEMKHVYSDTLELAKGIEELQIRDWLFERYPGVEALALRGLGLVTLFPLFLVSIIPTGLLFLIPRIFIKKMIKDQMFVSTFNVAVSALVSIPICLFIPVIVLWCMLGFWWGLGYAIAFPLMFILAWNYIRLSKKFAGTWNFTRRKNRRKVAGLRSLRKDIFSRIDKMI